MKRRNVLKPVAVLFLSVLFMSLSLVTASADLIWEPTDQFYLKHRNDCTIVNRDYTAEGEEGYITIWESPESDKKIAVIPNASTVRVLYKYHDKNGTNWGCINFSYERDGVRYSNGFVLLGELAVVYDSISFYEEHKNELHNYNGEFNSYQIKDQLILWPYPYSKVNHSLSYSGELDCSRLSFEYTYTDQYGYLWGYTSFYFYGRSSGWICINYPEELTIPLPKKIVLPGDEETVPDVVPFDNEEPVANNAVTPSENQNTSPDNEILSSDSSDTNLSETSENLSGASHIALAAAENTLPVVQQSALDNHRNTKILIIPIVLIVAVIAATAILIFVFWKRKNTEE